MYRIFISHSWKYSNQYDKIVEFLDDGGVTYYNHSVPKDDPVHTNGTDKQLEDAIDAKIKGCSCVIILAGVYSSCSKWIKKKLLLLKSMANQLLVLGLGERREYLTQLRKQQMLSLAGMPRRWLML